MLINFPDIRVEISDNVLEVLSKYEQRETLTESGGILLGKHIPEEKYYLITAASEPCSSDRAGRLWFLRDHKAAQRIIDSAWENSNGVQNYVGEWHTHPWKSPKPSLTDKNLMKKLAKDQSNVWNHLFMIIGGLEDTFYFGVCDCSQKGKIIHETIIGG